MFKVIQFLSLILFNTYYLGECSTRLTEPVKQFSGATFGNMMEQQNWNFGLYGHGNLINDGFKILHLDSKSLDLEKSELINKMKRKCLSELPSDYVSIDKNTKYVHGVYARTFHRDVGMFSLKTSYPVFKALMYMNDGPMLSVVPGSHGNSEYKVEEVFLISSTSGTIILNNADVIHAGAINNHGENRRLIGITFSHKDDVNRVLNANKVKDSLESNNKDNKDNNRGWNKDKFVPTLQW